MKVQTNKEVALALRGFYDSHTAALDSMADKLPESLKPEIAGFRNSLAAQRAALPALDSIPDALDASWVMTQTSAAMERMQAYVTDLFNKLREVGISLGTKTVALNSIEERVTKGELVEKAKLKELAEVKELCGLARAEGIDSVKPEIIATRKASLELAGLPTPPEAILGLPAAEFKTHADACKANLALAGEKGLKLGGKGDAILKRAAWFATAEFAGEMAAIADLIGAPARQPVIGAGAGGNANASGKPELLGIL